MSLVVAHLDSFPEPVDGEATIALSLTVAQPEKRGDAEGWRARATCAETGRVVGRWMSDCPLSAAQSALLWLGMHPWEVLPEEGSYDYAEILEQVEEPRQVIHVDDQIRVLGGLLEAVEDARHARRDDVVHLRPAETGG